MFVVGILKEMDQSAITQAYVNGIKEDLGLFGKELEFVSDPRLHRLCYLQVPSQMLQTKLHPSLWLTFAEITWGVLTLLLYVPWARQSDHIADQHQHIRSQDRNDDLHLAILPRSAECDLVARYHGIDNDMVHNHRTRLPLSHLQHLRRSRCNVPRRRPTRALRQHERSKRLIRLAVALHRIRRHHHPARLPRPPNLARLTRENV